MVLRLILLYLTFFVFNLNYSQYPYSRLRIGDHVPEVAFNDVKNYPGKSRKLSDFKGKYIILDFWDKTCGACIAGMPKMQSLQQKFADDLQIILVTKNTKKALSELFERSAILKGISLPMVLSDSILTKYLFPYQYLPRHIWLDSAMRVLAITEAGNATEENIRAMIKGETLNFTVRDDRLDDIEMDKFYDVRKPMLSVENYEHLGKLRYFVSHVNTSTGYLSLSTSSFLNNSHQVRNSYSLITTKIDGLRSFRKVELRNEKEEQTGVRFINYSLDLLARFAYGYYGDIHTNTAGRVIFEPGLFNIPQDESDYLLWKDSMTFCYEAVIDEYTPEKLFSQLKKDFENFFRIRGEIEERFVRCWVFYRTTNSDLLPYAEENEIGANNPVSKYFSEKSMEGIVFSNRPFDDLVGLIATQTYSYLDPIVVFNETGYSTERIDLVLKIKDLKNIHSINAELNKYGIGVKEEMKKSRLLVLKRIAN